MIKFNHLHKYNCFINIILKQAYLWKKYLTCQISLSGYLFISTLYKSYNLYVPITMILVVTPDVQIIIAIPDYLH